MSSLQYSKGALNNLTLFHRRKFVVFVEGPQDVPFWNEVFGLAGIDEAYFKIAGGQPELQKYLGAVVRDGAKVVIAQDSHLSEFLGARPDHNRVMYTYGYAIENTLCSDIAIGRLLRIYLYSNEQQRSEAQLWLEDLECRLRPLVELDAAARIESSGLAIPLHNAHRFLDPHTADVVAAKVALAVRSVENDVSARALTLARSTIDGGAKPVRYFLRGHFLIGAVAEFICRRTCRKTGRKLTLSAAALYAALLSQLPSCLPKTDEWRHYDSQLQRLLAGA